MMRSLLFVVGSAVSLAAHAQLTAPVKNSDTTITVTGTRESKVEMSDWRVAETPHVVVFSQNDEEYLRHTAHNLEKLHFLLSALHGRVDAPDETIKIVVIMIGHAGEFEQLRLTDLRWQYGPFAPQFAKTIYYDPREEGPVLASTKEGANLVIRDSVGRVTNRNCAADGETPLVSVSFAPPLNPAGNEEWDGILGLLPVNEIAFCQSAASRIYAGFAQNYLMTYFPTAYPRWFLQGFGEMFATMKAGDNFVEYGQFPHGYFDVMENFGFYPMTDVLNGRYLSGEGPPWTPYHAWRLVHFLYFSDEWKPRLNNYLRAMARGADLQSAASAFGDPAELQKAAAFYRGRKVQFERMEFPAERAPPPVIRQMTRAEAGLIRGRLELGARIEVPAEGRLDRPAALDRRSAWLARLRENARQYPKLIEHQLLLAEAECRSGNPQACLEAAERALAQSPRDTTALVWKGTALAQLAVRAPVAERPRRLKDARSFIVQANRLDKDGILPLIAFYSSYAVAGEQAPDMAVEGLAKVVDSSPAAPTPRLKLGQEFIRRDLKEAARDTLLPVAKGAFDTPEKPAAAALLPEARAEPGS
jgi:hypothetical protein